MKFDLFGFDLLPSHSLYGFWFLNVDALGIYRSLFSLYFIEGELFFDLFFCRVFSGL